MTQFGGGLNLENPCIPERELLNGNDIHIAKNINIYLKNISIDNNDEDYSDFIIYVKMLSAGENLKLDILNIPKDLTVTVHKVIVLSNNQDIPIPRYIGLRQKNINIGNTNLYSIYQYYYSGFMFFTICRQRLYYKNLNSEFPEKYHQYIIKMYDEPHAKKREVFTYKTDPVVRGDKGILVGHEYEYIANGKIITEGYDLPFAEY